MNEDYQKAWRNFTLFFLSNPVPFNGQDYEKENGPGTGVQVLFRLRNKSRKVPLLVMYYLIKFDNLIWQGFKVIPKSASANSCKSI